MKKHKFLILIALCTCVSFASAQVLTLDSVLLRIEKTNPMLKMYDEEVLGIKNYAGMAKSWMPPTLSTGPWQTPYDNFSDGMWMITAEQMIQNPVKQKANYNYMTGMIPVEQTNRDARLNDMYTMAKQLYFEWVVLEKKYDVLLQIDSLLSYIVQVAQLRYTYNKEKLSNIYKSQAESGELKNMMTMIAGEMKMKNTELNALMNVNANTEFEIDTSVSIYDYENQPANPEAVSAVRSEIKLFDATASLAMLQQQYEKTKRLPDFGISVSHMQSLGSMPTSFAVMGMVTLPMVPWSSKEFKSNINGLENTFNAISFQKQEFVNETMGNILSLQTQIRSTKTQMLNYSENIVPAYYKSYRSSLASYEANTEDLFFVLENLRMYRMGKMDELDQLNQLLILQIAYEKEYEIK